MCQVYLRFPYLKRNAMSVIANATKRHEEDCSDLWSLSYIYRLCKLEGFACV